MRMAPAMHSMTVAKAYQQLLEWLPAFRLHELTRRHQAKFFREQKELAIDSEVVIQFDFAENYACSHQDATQTAYWNQAAVTLFTVAVYSSQAPKMFAFASKVFLQLCLCLAL